MSSLINDLFNDLSLALAIDAISRALYWIFFLLGDVSLTRMNVLIGHLEDVMKRLCVVDVLEECNWSSCWTWTISTIQSPDAVE